MTPEFQGTSTRPYLIRALHDWCTDNGLTPYLAVHVDDKVDVPAEYVKNNEIVLNVGFEATSGLQLGNEFIEFKARFGGVAREICVPVDHVVAIYARENGQGMAFPMPAAAGSASGVGSSPDGMDPEMRPQGARSAPRLTAVSAADAAPPVAQAHRPHDEEPQPPEPTTPRPALKRIK